MGAMFRLHDQKKNEIPVETGWAELISAEQWGVYEKVMDLANRRGIRFAVGGGFAFSYYSKRWRNTKDIDLYVMPSDREAMIQVTRDVGLADYFEEHPYDRAWIYRSYQRAPELSAEGDHAGGAGPVIVDIMWQMANYRAQVDTFWLTCGDLVTIRGWTVRMLPAEELMWSKMYILQRDRCDWGDLINILYARGPQLDWGRFVQRVGGDKRVLAAVVQLFAWACPGRALELPESLWGALGISAPVASEQERMKLSQGAVDPAHLRLLDSRDWFGPTPLPGHDQA